MGNKFDWDNGDLEEDEGFIEKEARIHPDDITEIPGVLLESDYENNIGPDIKPIPAPAYSKQAVAARWNANLDNDAITSAEITGVDPIIL